MRLTELLNYVNSEMPTDYVSSHLNVPAIKSNKDVKSLKRAIKKRKKEESQIVNTGKKNGTEDIDMFEDM